MKKWMIRIVVCLVLFLGSAGITIFMINREQTVGIRKMEEPRLPILYMEVENVMVNPMYGYAYEMEEQYMRDGLTPFTTSRDLAVVIDEMESTVSNVNYRVSTADGSEVVETGKVSSLNETGNDRLKAEFHLDHAILMNQEYTLRFEVELKTGKTYYYYTRIVQRAWTNISEYLDFAENFYQKCASQDNASDLATYIEPDETEAYSTYNTLNIHSSFDRITWGELNTALEKKAYPVIKDINETTCSIAVKYVVSDTQEDGVDYFNVTDFYRMRYAQSRVMLLDFERQTEQLFSGEDTELTSTGINLGIVSRNIQYRSNQSADIIAFVQEGELWTYNRSANKSTQVFSFRSGDLDSRKNLQNHGIKIVRVEESGDLDFVVYGYMNSDVHEGEVGIAVYHYGAELNQLEEQLFIPMRSSYEYLKRDMEQLSYVTRDDRLYLVLEEQLYEINIKGKTYQIIQEGLGQDCLVTSSSQESIAWMDQMDENNSTSITVMNLEMNQRYQVQAGTGQKIKALGFMNEDLVYGLANDADIVTDNAGNVTFAMTSVRIAEFGGQVVKEYHEDGVWVDDVELSEGLLELKRVELQENTYVSISSDHIMNNLQKNDEKITIRLINTEREATRIGLDFDKSVTSKNVLSVNSNLVDQTGNNTVAVEVTKPDSNIYYVYAKGILDSTWTKVNQAILRADSQMGIVLNRQQQYVWERGNKETTYLANLDEVPEIILSGTIDEATIQQSLGEDYIVLNMTGCTLDNVLYQVNKGNPVIAKVSETENVVIVGYDNYNTILYYPSTGEQDYYGLQDSTALFEAAGNVFIGYMDSLAAPVKG